MGKFIDYFNEKYYLVAGAGSVVAAGVVGSVASAAMGGIGMVIGAGVGIGSMVGASLLRPRSAEEIEALTASRRQMSLEEILKPVLEAGEQTLGDQRTTERTLKDLRKIQELLSQVKARRATLGDGFLKLIADMLEDTQTVARNLAKINQNDAALMRFDTLLYKNIPLTINAFLDTSGAHENEAIRADFKSQIDLLHRAVQDIDSSIKALEIHNFQANGEYLKINYGDMKPIEQ